MTGSAVVVGGTGCVGTAVVRRLAECGWRVTSVSRVCRTSSTTRVPTKPTAACNPPGTWRVTAYCTTVRSEPSWCRRAFPIGVV